MTELWHIPRNWISGEFVSLDMMDDEVRDNMQFLHDQGTQLTAAVTITPTTQFHAISGTTPVVNITAGTAGSRLTLICNSGVVTIADNRTSGGNIYLAGQLPAALALYESIELVTEGTNWFEVNRTALDISGAFVDLATSTTPLGYLPRDGSAVSRTTYAALFVTIGTGYGVGNGSSTFNVPDSQGRVTVGLGSHADVNLFTDNDGLSAANRTPKFGTGLITNGQTGGTTHLLTADVNGPAYNVAGGYIRI